MIDYTDQANAAKALAEAAQLSGSDVSPELAMEAAFSGGGRSVMDLIRRSQEQYAQKNRLQAERANVLAKLRAAAAMQGPELENKLQIAQIGAQRPAEAGLWNLLRAQQMGANQANIQGMRGQQAETVQGMKGQQSMAQLLRRGEQRKEEIALTGEQRLALERLRGMTAEQIQQLRNEGMLAGIEASNEGRMAVAQLIQQKLGERQTAEHAQRTSELATKEKGLGERLGVAEGGQNQRTGIREKGAIERTKMRGGTAKEVAATRASKSAGLGKVSGEADLRLLSQIRKEIIAQLNGQTVWAAGPKKGQPITKMDIELAARRRLDQMREAGPEAVQDPTQQ